MAVPGDIFRNGSQGTNALIFRGEARAVTSAADVLDTLGISVDPVQLALHPGVEPDADERPIADQLNALPKHIDTLAQSAGLPAHRVSAILTMLELKGLARHVGGGRYVHPRPEPAGGERWLAARIAEGAGFGRVSGVTLAGNDESGQLASWESPPPRGTASAARARSPWAECRPPAPGRASSPCRG